MAIMSKDDFKRLYKKTNGFMPEQSPNHPLLSADGVSSYYSDLEEGCDILIKNNPELVRIPKGERK